MILAPYYYLRGWIGTRGGRVTAVLLALAVLGVIFAGAAAAYSGHYDHWHSGWWYDYRTSYSYSGGQHTDLYFVYPWWCRNASVCSAYIREYRHG